MTLEELKHILAEASQVFVLTDEHVAPLWMPEAEHWLGCERAVEIVVKAGESHKNLNTVRRIWQTLLKHGADRNSVLINLGGGVITDLGGFAASCYQRGIRFVNVPTTLLAMVDAAWGGKTGIDFEDCKNQIGVFAQPLDVVVKPVLLSTLPERELRSGMAEMVKCGFIADKHLLKVCPDNFEQYLLRAGAIKNEIATRDPFDHGCRKMLNFGHTLGHAIESVALKSESPLTHGEAVAIGMACALRISLWQCGLSESVVSDYEPTLKMLLAKAPSIPITINDVEAIMAFLVHDKKNRHGDNAFVLLEDVERPVWDRPVPEQLVRKSLSEVIPQL